MQRIPPRRGLAESLEEYAARLGRSVHDTRLVWRLEGLRLLHVHPGSGDPFETIALLERGLCAIAPGVAVPTSNGPTEIER